LEISLAKQRERFICGHTRVFWAAERGHLSFDPKENLFNRRDLLFDRPFSLPTLGGWLFL
jgi:hypothetical protein